jgi:outer membrane protein
MSRLKISSAWPALFLSVCLPLLSQSAVAQPTPEEMVSQITADFEAADDATRARQLILLAKSGQHELAAELLATHPLEGAHAANRVLFIEGLIARGRGDNQTAVDKFRSALANDPKLTLVRSELATTLMAMDEGDSAKHHLKLLAADAPTEQDAVGIRAYIDQIDANRPYQFNAYVSLAPSTNINNGSTHKKVYSPLFGADLDIDKGGRRKSGIGGAVGGNAAFNHRFNENFMVVAAGQAEARIYDDFDFNAYSISQSLEGRYLTGNGYFGLGAVASQSLTNDASDLAYLSYGPRASTRIDISKSNTLTASSTFEWRDAQGGSTFDSTALMLNGALTHAINSSFNFTVSAGFDDVTFDNSVLSYDAWSAGLSVYKELPFGVTADVFGHMQFKTHDEESFLAGKTQKDHRLTTGLTLTKRDFDIFGFAPALSYTYINNMSNITIYDYDAHAIDFRLTKDF